MKSNILNLVEKQSINRPGKSSSGKFNRAKKAGVALLLAGLAMDSIAINVHPATEVPATTISKPQTEVIQPMISNPQQIKPTK